MGFGMKSDDGGTLGDASGDLALALVSAATIMTLAAVARRMLESRMETRPGVCASPERAHLIGRPLLGRSTGVPKWAAATAFGLPVGQRHARIQSPPACLAPSPRPTSTHAGGLGAAQPHLADPPSAHSAHNSPISTHGIRLHATAPDTAIMDGKPQTSSFQPSPAPGPPAPSPAAWEARTPLPSNRNLHELILPNGLRCLLLPNSAPSDRFEAHLEVLAGAVDERDDQQGMAHMVEHIAYMGNRKRATLFGTGSQTNAYTDFHHTVYYTSCPVVSPTEPNTRTSMLQRSLGTLADVFECRFETARLEKERSAVLSEAAMVNTLEYRVECAILTALHSENTLSRRFPIGMKDQIERWDIRDVKEFHSKHYRPDNAVLYLVGDLSLEEMKTQLESIMGRLPTTLGSRPMSRLPFGGKGRSPPKPAPSLKLQSRHFPPVLHVWSGGGQDYEMTANVPPPVPHSIDPRAFVAMPGEPVRSEEVMDVARETERAHMLSNTTTAAGQLHVFQHPMLSSASFHLFAKRPIVPNTTVDSYRDMLASRVALQALQVRLSVLSRNEPLFNYIEVANLDSSREGCAVCSLDMGCEPSMWETALGVALSELRTFAAYGITQDELRRGKRALQSDAAQWAAQGDTCSSMDHVSILMEMAACGNTVMTPMDTLVVSTNILESLTMEEVSDKAIEIGSHVMAWTDTSSHTPSAFVATAPTSLGLTEEQLLDFALAIVEQPPAPPSEVVLNAVPATLLPAEAYQTSNLSASDIEAVFDQAAESVGSLGGPMSPVDDGTVIMRRMHSGLRLNYRCTADEPQRAFLRVCVPGGRAAEACGTDDEAAQLGPKTGSITLGGRTIQEGGAMGGLSRTQVELFCVEHMIQVIAKADYEFVNIDFVFPTKKVAGETGLSGTEAVFQIVRQLLAPSFPHDQNGLVWEEDAMYRAVAGLVQQQEQEKSSLEGCARAAITNLMSNEDLRFRGLDANTLRDLTLEDVAEAMDALLTPERAEISISGDIPASEVEELAARYLGTLKPAATTWPAQPSLLDGRRPPAEQGAVIAMAPAEVAAEAAAESPAVSRVLRSPFAFPSTSILPSQALVEATAVANETVTQSHVNVTVPDPDKRAIAHVSGLAPNRWGITRDGVDLRLALGIFPLSPTDEEAARRHRSTLYNCPPGTRSSLEEARDQADSLKYLTDAARRAQPLWPVAALAVAQEVVNRRLFAQVREQRGLTYEANFQLSSFDRLAGGWWLVSVTATPAKVNMALDACLETLEQLRPNPDVPGGAIAPATLDHLIAAQRVIVARHMGDLRFNQFWTEIMSGSQLPCIPNMGAEGGAAFMREWAETVKAVTVADINLILHSFGLDRSSLYTCIATSGGDGDVQDRVLQEDRHGHTIPGLASHRPEPVQKFAQGRQCKGVPRVHRRPVDVLRPKIVLATRVQYFAALGVAIGGRCTVRSVVPCGGGRHVGSCCALPARFHSDRPPHALCQ